MAVRETSKQLRSLEEHVACDVCGRTMLKGERPESYLAPSRERKTVCQLCAQRAQKEGWIRESANPATPVQPPRPSERRRLFKRRRPRMTQDLPERDDGFAAREAPEAAHSGDGAEAQPAGRRPGVLERRSRPRDPRHVRAVPTNAQVKVERAIELFNDSEHPRTVAGIARTLGEPQVSACTSSVSSAKVLLTVAWELSWYQFTVDLSDSNDPVRLRGRGQELKELPSKVRRWNATATEDGRIAMGGDENSNGEAGEDGL
jgi:hypothetical protein